MAPGAPRKNSTWRCRHEFKPRWWEPGIDLATYRWRRSSCSTRPIPDVWSDPRLDFADTIEETRAGRGMPPQPNRHVRAQLFTPGDGWRVWRVARKEDSCRSLKPFSQETVPTTSVVHVLNGKQVRQLRRRVLARRKQVGIITVHGK